MWMLFPWIILMYCPSGGWRLSYLIMEEAPAWLDEEQQGQEDEEEQEEEQEEEADRFDPKDFMEGDVASSAPPSTLVDVSSPPLAPSTATLYSTSSVEQAWETSHDLFP